MDTLRIIQRFRHLFYTPQFVVMHLGVLEQEGLRVELTTATSAAEVNEKLLTGEADLGLGGPIRTLELAEHGSQERLISILEVNSRNGFFLLAREPQPQFQWADLVGRRLILFAEAPTPWLCLQHDLRLQGTDPAQIDGVTDRTMADNLESLRRGQLDVVQMFEPYVSMALRSGAGNMIPLSTVLRVSLGKGFALENDLPFGHLVARVAQNRVGERGLARPVGAHQRVDLALGDGQVDAAQDLALLGADVQVSNL